MPEEPADTMRERSPRSTAWAYVLFDANRKLVAVGLLLGVFLGLVGLSVLLPAAESAITSGDPVETGLQALIGATITGVTLVLTLNQLVLSQELGAVGDQRERMEGAMEFRDDVADVLGDSVSPAEPSAFLRALVDHAGDRARAVRDAVDEPDDDLETLLDSTEENADEVSEGLSDATFGEFDVLSAALDFNYSWKLYAARRALAGRDEDDPAVEPLEELVEALRLFGPAREHFKTLYFQSELIALSRAVLAVALPSLVVNVAALLFVDLPKLSGSLLGVPVNVLAASAVVAVAVAPFVVLLSYVLRIATVTGRTLSIGPFILRRTDRSTDE
jgi:hypothetical protein